MKDMSNTLKKSFVFKRFYLELVEKYGTARAKDIWNYAENELLGLRIAEPSADKALELGTPEAVQMICCMDKEYMNGFRGVNYKRTKSVAEGDDCCDYRLTKSL
jgi:hypothetical protein